jgi:septum formation protein
MLVLASASPRRQELLRNANIAFTVQPANIPEQILPGEAPRDVAERLAREKALVVADTYSNGYVLGADTVVVVNSEILGKPSDAADAVRMLQLLSGGTHEVITGVCLVGGKESNSSKEHDVNKIQQFVDVRSELTTVTMNNLSDDDIHSYVSSGEPMNKAGAYAIQGRASRWISRIEGDYFNVVGLPISLVFRMLREHGVI